MLDKIGRATQSLQPVFTQHQEKTAHAQVKNEATDAIKTAKFQKDKMEKVVQGMNEFLKPSNTHLKFEFHDELQEYYVAIVDDITQEVVKEIPSKKLLDIYAAMTDFLGVLVDKKI